MRRTWGAGLLVAGLLAMAACGGDGDGDGDGGSVDEPDEPAERAEADGTTTSTEADLDAQLDAVRAAFDRSVDARTVAYDLNQAISLPAGSAYAAASYSVDGGFDQEADHGSGRVTIHLIGAGVEPTSTTTDVRVVDGLVWIAAREGWLGWTVDAAESSVAVNAAAATTDAAGVLLAMRDSIEEVIEHSPMVAGTDQWVVRATPPAAFGFLGAGPVEMTIKTGAGGVISTILYTTDVPTDQLEAMIAPLAGQVGAAPTVSVEVEVVVDAVDGPLPSPVEQPCATPEPVAGPDGASRRCPATG